MKSKTLILMMVVASGCTHHQLRYNTVQQARTVADVHTQQVLDNLAKFSQNPEALPHFSFPQAGSTSVNDSVGNSGPSFSFSPHALNSWSLGFSGNRGMQEAYTMVPLNDPRKLELMRCAYQRAVRGQCSCEANGCPNCVFRFNKFYLGSERPGKTVELSWDHKPIYMLYDSEPQACLPANAQAGVPYVRDTNDFNETVYRALENRDICITKDEAQKLAQKKLFKPVFVDNSLALHTLRTGKTTIDCVGTCWFKIGTKNDFKHLRSCCPVGSYCGTYICVPQENIGDLSKLTMVILDIALNDNAVVPTSTKEVVAFLNSHGEIADNRATSVYRVTRTVDAAEGLNAVALPKPSDPKREAQDLVRAYGMADSQIDSLSDDSLLEKLRSQRSAAASQLSGEQQSYFDSVIRQLEDSIRGVAPAGGDTFEQIEAGVDQSLELPYQPVSPTPGTNLLLEDLRLRTLTPNN